MWKINKSKLPKDHVLTTRLPEYVYKEIKTKARGKQQTISKYVREVLTRKSAEI